MATFEYTKFSFNRPQRLEEKDYKCLKLFLMENPNHSLNPKTSFFQTFKIEIIFIGVAIVSATMEYVKAPEWIQWILILPAIIGIFSALRLFLSSFSYVGFVMNKYLYYKRLKNDVLRSKDYNDFIRIRVDR